MDKNKTGNFAKEKTMRNSTIKVITTTLSGAMLMMALGCGTDEFPAVEETETSARAETQAKKSSAVSTATCALWDVGGQFTVTQTNGFAPVFRLQQSPSGIITGSAYYDTNWGRQQGWVAEGSHVTDSRFYVVIQWNAGPRGAYSGTFTSYGHLSGTAYDQRNPWSRASWTVNDRQFFCFRPY